MASLPAGRLLERSDIIHVCRYFHARDCFHAFVLRHWPGKWPVDSELTTAWMHAATRRYSFTPPAPAGSQLAAHARPGPGRRGSAIRTAQVWRANAAKTYGATTSSSLTLSSHRAAGPNYPPARGRRRAAYSVTARGVDCAALEPAFGPCPPLSLTGPPLGRAAHSEPQDQAALLSVTARVTARVVESCVAAPSAAGRRRVTVSGPSSQQGRWWLDSR